MGKAYIITGIYGSGKTEFCVNLAMQLAAAGGRVTIADMDVINPYFRSREREDFLAQYGIDVIGSGIANRNIQDLPSLDFSFIPRVRQGENVIIDLAGGENGLKLLARCYDALKAVDYEFLCVFNSFRPDSSSVEKMVGFAQDVNNFAQIKLTGLVNNGNLIRETSAKDVLDSQDAVLAAGLRLGLPLRWTMFSKKIYEQIADEVKSEQVMVFDEPLMREKWQ